jgi:UDP-GlcNAc:undecaprenyl-phosphate GlcNAc-1-phosphate transferase
MICYVIGAGYTGPYFSTYYSEKRKKMDSLQINLIFTGLISFLITFLLVPFLCKIAIKLNVVDSPDGKIKLHEKTTPYLGGVAVFFGFTVALALTLPYNSNLFLFFIGSTLALLVGLIDDLVVLTPRQKFCGQVIAASCFLKAGFYVKEIFFYNFWNVPLSLFWIILIMNAFNLVDVMDGLATLLAIGAASSFLVIALYIGQHAVATLLTALLGALAAFFWYNKPTAKIYLGDAGSLFIGSVLATVPFLFKWGIYTPYGYFTPFIVLALPLLEVTTLIVIRTYKKIPFYKGSPDHFCLYLQAKGWSASSILVYIFCLNIILGIIATLFLSGSIHLINTVFIGFIFIFFWYVALLPKKTL